MLRKLNSSAEEQQHSRFAASAGGMEKGGNNEGRGLGGTRIDEDSVNDKSDSSGCPCDGRGGRHILRRASVSACYQQEGSS